MKKIISLLLVITLLTALFVGCAKDDETPDTTETPDATTETPDATTDTDTDDVDAVTTASLVDNGDDLVAALRADGTWIASALNDLVVEEDIVVEGEFTNRDVVDRKLALYTQDEDRNITAQFTLTAPKLIVKSPNFRIGGGTFKGDVYVEANGFKLDKASTVDGDIYFASKEALDTFTMADTSAVTGVLKLEDVDVVSTASLVTSPQALVDGLSADGVWLVATYNNMILSEDLVVEGEFIHREAIARKLGLYTQDADRNITASFTLTAPSMIVKSENFKLQGGTFIGDVYVEANGFHIAAGSVDGNVYFASQEYMDSMVEDETGSVTGVIEVQ